MSHEPPPDWHGFRMGQRVRCTVEHENGFGIIPVGTLGEVADPEWDTDGDYRICWDHIPYGEEYDFTYNYCHYTYLAPAEQIPDLTDPDAVDAWLERTS